MSNLPILPKLDFGGTDTTPQNLGTDSQPYLAITNEIHPESELNVQYSPSFSEASSFSDPKGYAPDSPVDQPNLNTSRHGFTQYCLNWKWESIACLFILACPIIIIITLYPYAGQPLPQWPFRITINTLLSIYSLVFKTCLTFVAASCIGQLQWSWFSSNRPLYDLVRYDRATRGPWGSIQLLWSQNIRHPLTVLGPIILIAAIAIDPFVQQLVAPFDCSVTLLTRNATLPRTNQLDYTATSSAYNYDPPVRTAVYTPSEFISWQCSTGNCTFSTSYSTVGYCGGCEDWSEKLIFNTTCYDSFTNTNTTSTTGSCDENSHYLPTSSLYIGDLGKYNSNWINVTPTSRNSKYEVAESSHWHDVNLAIGSEKSVVLIPKNDDSDEQVGSSTHYSGKDCNTTAATSNTWRCKGYGAAVCSLQPCIRTYNATVNAGQLDEREISNTGALPWGVSARSYDDDLVFKAWIAMVDTHCISDEERKNLTHRGYQIDSSSQWLGFNKSVTNGTSLSVDELELSLLSHHCLYLMENILEGTFPYWQALLSDNLWGVVSKNQIVAPDVTNDYQQFEGPPMMIDLYNNSYVGFERVHETFSNLSDIMTAWIRTHGNSTYSDPAIGEVLHYATCLRVEWLWLAFPAILAILALVFFVAVVVVTDRQRVPVWKSSPLAWIMRGTDAEFWSEDDTAGMEKRSKEVVVSLVKGSDPRIQVVEGESELAFR